MSLTAFPDDLSSTARLATSQWTRHLDHNLWHPGNASRSCNFDNSWYQVLAGTFPKSRRLFRNRSRGAANYHLRVGETMKRGERKSKKKTNSLLLASGRRTSKPPNHPARHFVRRHGHAWPNPGQRTSSYRVLQKASICSFSRTLPPETIQIMCRSGLLRLAHSQHQRLTDSTNHLRNPKYCVLHRTPCSAASEAVRERLGYP